MLDLFTDSKTVVVLFLLAVLGMLILANPTGKPVPAQIGSASQTWSLDYDGGGMYPAADCGRNYWLQMFLPGQNPCAVRAQKTDPIEDQAIEDMKADNVGPFDDATQAIETMRDYVGAVLERIAPAW